MLLTTAQSFNKSYHIVVRYYEKENGNEGGLLFCEFCEILSMKSHNNGAN